MIFIHNPRAAGTSVRRALCHGRNPNKIIPPPGNIPAGGSSNQKHAFASWVRGRVSKEDWDNKFKFAIVRNPHDRVVSLYGLFRRPMEVKRQRRTASLQDAKQPYKIDKLMWTLIHPDKDVAIVDIPKNDRRAIAARAFRQGFKGWLLHTCEVWKWNCCRYVDATRSVTEIPQSKWFSGLDRVFKFEELDDLYDHVTGMGYDLPVPENKTKHAPWESYYDAETFDLVAGVFKEDIQRFGY